MGKTFRDWDIEQLMMFPPSVEDFVPQGHVAHFVRSTVSEALDLSAIVDCYNEERGYPPYHPVMMTARLLYAYCQGIYPSRRIAKACRERVDFMAVTGIQTPDFRTISDFRKRHMTTRKAMFVQVLRLWRWSGSAKEERARDTQGFGANQLHRPTKPDHEKPRRVYSRLQRSGRCGCR